MNIKNQGFLGCSKIGDFRHNKKGISALIETVLLILVVIAAVGIVAGLLIPMIRTATERTANCQGLVDINAASASSVTYTIIKDIAPGSVTGTNLIAYNDTGATGSIGGATTFIVGTPITASITGAVGTVKKVGVIATIKTQSLKTVTCPTVEAII